MTNITIDRADGGRRGRTNSYLLSEESKKVETTKKAETARKAGTTKIAETARNVETARNAETTKKHSNMHHLKWL